jgi:hypothetical protein
MGILIVASIYMLLTGDVSHAADAAEATANAVGVTGDVFPWTSTIAAVVTGASMVANTLPKNSRAGIAYRMVSSIVHAIALNWRTEKKETK